MNTQVSANYSHKPLLFILIPLVLFFFLRNIGVWVFIGFLTPLFQYFTKVFTRYKLQDNHLVIKSLFRKKVIAIDKISRVETKQANGFQQLMVALPKTYQIVHYNTYDEVYISPKQLLMHDLNTHTFYFKPNT